MSIDPKFLITQQGKQYVLYSGLLAMAHEQGLHAIKTTLVQLPGEMNGYTAICHATVFTDRGEYHGIGDANAGNVNRMMAPHIMRMAETRAKARALRDAVNVGVTAFEELAADEPGGSWPGHEGSGDAAPKPVSKQKPVEQPRVRALTDDELLAQKVKKYDQLAAQAAAWGITAEPLPANSDLNTVIDMGTDIQDKIKFAIAQSKKGAQR